jgi:hypothetical protein
MRTAFAVVALAALLTACGSTTPVPAPLPTASASATATVVETPQSPDVAALAKRVTDAIPGTTFAVYTETTDPNKLLGRPNGYTAGAFINDPRVGPIGADAAPGDIQAASTVSAVIIEVWPTAADAQARSDYIQGIEKTAPMMGSEYDHISGSALLRVSGILPPSINAEYTAAWGS